MAPQNEYHPCTVHINFLLLINFNFIKFINSYKYAILLVLLQETANFHKISKNIEWSLEHFFFRFSSPEPKAEVSYFDQFLSCVCLSVHMSVNILHIRFFLQNNQAESNQTWHKASLIEGEFKFVKMKR